MAAQNFKLFLGCLGNGVTVCNSAVMEDGDFKMVAHISNEGKITWYVGEDSLTFAISALMISFSH